MSRNLGAWTQAPATPLSDGYVQYVSVNEEGGRVGISVRNTRGDVVCAELEWPEFLELVGELNTAIAKHRRSTKP